MLSPPGRDVGLIAPRRALELLQEEAEAAGRIDEVLICDSGAAQKEMAEALQRPRKKEHGRADVAVEVLDHVAHLHAAATEHLQRHVDDSLRVLGGGEFRAGGGGGVGRSARATA